MNIAHNSRARRRGVRDQQHRSSDIDLFAVGQEVRWVASMVLEQAVKDLGSAVSYEREMAHDFILGRDFECWADMIDLDVQAAREALDGRLKAAVRGLDDGGADGV